MATPTLLPLPEAAARLGLSPSALRRRLRAGAARGERRPTASGFMWWVDVEGDVDGTPDAVRTPSRAAPTPDTVRTALPVQAQRAEEMARYSQQLLAPYVAQIADLSEKVGRLEAELEHARPLTASDATSVPAWPEQRRWWQRLLWG